jgi:hypothetical protein
MRNRTKIEQIKRSKKIKDNTSLSISLHIYSYCSQSCMTIQSLYMQSVEYKQLISSFEEDYSQNNYILHGSNKEIKEN